MQLIKKKYFKILKYLLIFNFNFYFNYNFNLDKKPTISKPKLTISEAEKNIKTYQTILQLTATALKITAFGTVTAETARTIKLLELLSKLSPRQFSDTVEAMIPATLRNIIETCVNIHRRKCLYDDLMTEYRATYNLDQNLVPIPVVVSKAGGAGAKASARDLLTLDLTRTPELVRRFGNHLSSKAKSVKTEIKAGWHDGLRRVQSFATSRSQVTENPKLVARSTKTIAQPQTPSSLLVGDSNLTVPSPAPPNLPYSSAYYRAKGPDLSRAEIEAQVRHHDYIKLLMHRTHYVSPALIETSQPATGPFFYAENLSTTENIERYNKHLKTSVDARLAKYSAEQTIRDRIRKRMFFSDFTEEDDLTKLLDQFAGIKSKTDITSLQPKQAGPNLVDANINKNELMEDIRYILRDHPAPKPSPKPIIVYWPPPQDYYCTYLYQDKKKFKS